MGVEWGGVGGGEVGRGGVVGCGGMRRGRATWGDVGLMWSDAGWGDVELYVQFYHFLADAERPMRAAHKNSSVNKS